MGIHTRLRGKSVNFAYNLLHDDVARVFGARRTNSIKKLETREPLRNRRRVVVREPFLLFKSFWNLRRRAYIYPKLAENPVSRRPP